MIVTINLTAMIIFMIIMLFLGGLIGGYITFSKLEATKNDEVFGDIILDLTDAEKDVIRLEYSRSISDMIGKEKISFRTVIRERVDYNSIS